jgi:ATP-dependent helicase HrpA
MARIPLDPRISRMLLEALQEDVLHEVAIIAAALSIRDPRERPPEKAREADAVHAPFRDPDSDFLTLLNIWDRYQSDWTGMRSTSEKRRFCHEHFLSFPRMREWVYVHDQIRDILGELRLPVGRTHRAEMSPRLYAAIHQSVASGLLSRVAVLKEKHQYTAAKGREAMLFPGSSLFARPPGWVVAAEIVQTARVWLRTAARIEPSWLEALGGELCRRSYHDPAWDKGRGEVRANERVTLFGLEIVAGRPVPFGPIDPEAAQKIFIRDGLLAGQVKEPFAFLKHNLALRARFEGWEDKLRRRDIIADEKDLAAFYARRLPGIHDVKGLEKVLKRRGTDDFLRMKEEDVVRCVPTADELALYPDEIRAGELRLRLAYKFIPGAEEDGVTIRLRSDHLSLLPVETIDWGIPGYYPEKIAELVRGLPQRYRKFLVPAAENVEIVVREMPRGEGSIYEALAKFAKRRFRAEIPASVWSQVEIPAHLEIRLSVIGPEGREVASGRDLESLIGFKPEMPVADTSSASWEKARERWERESLVDWDFGPLPESVPLGGGILAYPALEPAGRGAVLRLFKTREEAAAAHPGGVAALLLPKFAKDLKYMERHLALPEELKPTALYFGGKAALEKMMLENLKFQVFRRDIRTPEEFRAYAEGVVRALFEKGTALLAITTKILEEYGKLRTDLDAILAGRKGSKAIAAAVERIKGETGALIPNNFIEVYSPDRLSQIPRYLEALRLRAARAKDSPDKDRMKGEEIKPFLEALAGLRARAGEKSSAALGSALEEFRWMVEEFKVAVFAPEIRTAFPVSAKRLAEKLRALKALADAEAPARSRPKVAAFVKLGRRAGVFLAACAAGILSGSPFDAPAQGLRSVPGPKPWGAMYAPIAAGASQYGMTGIVTYVRAPNFLKLLSDLREARANNVKLIVTLGTTDPSAFMDPAGRAFDFELFYGQEIAPFWTQTDIRQAVVEALVEGTIWGFRILDEPHDRQDCATNVVAADRMTYRYALHPAGMAGLLNRLAGDLAGMAADVPILSQNPFLVRVGSTAPPDYMDQVRLSGVGGALFGGIQYRWPSPGPSLEETFKSWGDYAAAKGIALLGSLNSNSSTVADTTFFESLISLCRNPRVDFVTSWQWTRAPTGDGRSFQERADAVRTTNVQLWARTMARCFFPR